MPNEKIDFNANIQFTLSIGFSQSQSNSASIGDLVGSDKEEWDRLTLKEQREELDVCLSSWQNNYIESNWSVSG